MPTECREYIAVPSVGDAERCEQEQVMLSLRPPRRFTAVRILGYAVRIIRGPESVIDEDFDGEDVAASPGAGSLPCGATSHSTRP